MTEIKRERELKFDVPPGFEVPDVTDVIKHASIEQSVLNLRSTYFDTVELDLLGHAVTLRRREGDEDTGWQLKIPAGGARDEVRMPLDARDQPPERLVTLLAGIIRAGSLTAVATLETERRLTRVRRDGGLVVEIADDRVVATAEDGRNDAWREIEIELGDAGDEKALSAFARRLVKSGATTSAHSSKLARALGRSRPARGLRSEVDQLVTDYVQAQFHRLVAGDIALRRGQDERVHRTRVSAHRIRSVLRVFAGVFDPTPAQALDAELSWYQDLLGEVRDRQVQRAHFAEAIAALPVELVLGPVAGRIEQTLLAEQMIALENVTAALATDRYRRLLGLVGAFADGASLSSATRPEDLHHAAAKAARKAAQRLRRATRDQDPVTLHRARRALKRARHSAELIAARHDHEKPIKAYKRAQDVLGAHQDAIVSADLLRQLGTRAGSSTNENGFAYGVLYQRELDAAQRLRSDAARLHIPTWPVQELCAPSSTNAAGIRTSCS